MDKNKEVRFPAGSRIERDLTIWATACIEGEKLHTMLAQGFEPYGAGSWAEPHPLNPAQAVIKRLFFLRCRETLTVVHLPNGRFQVLPPGQEAIVDEEATDLEPLLPSAALPQYQQFPAGSQEFTRTVYENRTVQVGTPELPSLCVDGWEPYAADLLCMPHPDQPESMLMVREVHLRKPHERRFVVQPDGEEYLLPENLIAVIAPAQIPDENL